LDNKVIDIIDVRL